MCRKTSLGLTVTAVGVLAAIFLSGPMEGAVILGSAKAPILNPGETILKHQDDHAQSSFLESSMPNLEQLTEDELRDMRNSVLRRHFMELANDVERLNEDAAGEMFDDDLDRNGVIEKMLAWQKQQGPKRMAALEAELTVCKADLAVCKTQLEQFESERTRIADLEAELAICKTQLAQFESERAQEQARVAKKQPWVEKNGQCALLTGQSVRCMSST